MSSGKTIEFREVGYTYPGSSEPAVSDISLSIRSGEILVLVGANGSGKSTLAKLCNGLSLPTSGSVLVEGIDTCDPDRVYDIRSRVGLVLQNPDNQIVGTVVEEDVAFGPENLGVPREDLRVRVDAALQAVGLWGMERREPHLLSEGQKQRLAIAGALAMRPEFLVLDEPTAMLDPNGRADVMRVLRQLRDDGAGIVHITHHLGDVALADRVVALQHGVIRYDGPGERFLSDEKLLSDLGLERPPLAQLGAMLRSSGFDIVLVEDDPSAMVDALWR